MGKTRKADKFIKDSPKGKPGKKKPRKESIDTMLDDIDEELDGSLPLSTVDPPGSGPDSGTEDDPILEPTPVDAPVQGTDSLHESPDDSVPGEQPEDSGNGTLPVNTGTSNEGISFAELNEIFDHDPKRFTVLAAYYTIRMTEAQERTARALESLAINIHAMTDVSITEASARLRSPQWTNTPAPVVGRQT